MADGSQMQHTGRRLPRWRDKRLVMGLGRYTDDIRSGRTPLVVAFVRSPHAHARIRSIDTRAALAHPDTVAVITARDLQGSFKPYWSGLPQAPMRRSALLPLALDKVRMVGEPVVAVVARNRYQAEDIAALVAVEYEPLPPVVDAVRALTDASVRLYEEWPDNVVMHQEFQSSPEVEAVFAGAHRVVKRRVRSNRHTAVPMETRGIIADYDRGTESLTVWIGHQDVHLVRMTLADLLSMPLANVRVIAPDTGGAFGIKLPIYPEELAVTWMACKLGQPVKWIQDRREGLLCDTHARDALVDAELAVDRDGQFVGLRCRIISDAGSYAVAGRAPVVEGTILAREMTGPYKIRHYAYDLNVVMTNKAPIAVYRGVGGPVATLVMETMVEAAARELGMDRIEIRRKNLIDAFPWRTPTGHTYDSGRYRECLDQALALAQLDQLRAQQATWRAQGRLVGIGITCLTDASARNGSFYGRMGGSTSGQEGCRLQVDPTGRATAYLGTTSQGQGLHTAVAQIIADQLALDPADVHVVMGDTDATPIGGGAYSSRGAVTGGAVAMLASQALAEKIKRIAGHLLEADPDDLELAGGQAMVRGAPDRALTLAHIARTAYYITPDLPPGTEPGLQVVKNWEPPLPATFSNGTHVAMVEVDPGTGGIQIHKWLVVEDCGTILNPALVDGQVRGALAQGLGGALLEHMVYNADGQVTTGSLMDYLLPTTHDVPPVEIHHIETPSTVNIGGMKGVAESATLGGPATIVNAVADALGVDVTELPLSPPQVLKLLRRRQTPA